ncbi:MAG: hypothetical protein U5M50_05665 [Sphingobium sp.]|nr:hypothetical protein [Sphingobium sp.]
MALLIVIRRWHFRDHLFARKIARRAGLSRNTIRKYLRADRVEPRFKKLVAERLPAWLGRKMGRTRRRKRTMSNCTLIGSTLIITALVIGLRPLRETGATIIAANR